MTLLDVKRQIEKIGSEKTVRCGARPGGETNTDTMRDYYLGRFGDCPKAVRPSSK